MKGAMHHAPRSLGLVPVGDPGYFPRDDLFGEAILITRWDMHQRNNCDIRAAA